MFSEQFFIFWSPLHTLARTLPRTEILSTENKLHIIRLIESTVHLIPCAGCRVHAKQYLVDHPLSEIQTGNDAFDYTVAFHNEVNKGKGSPVYTSAEAEKALERQLQGDLKDLPRAVVMQKESDAKIAELQKKIELQKNALTPAITSADKNNDVFVLSITTCVFVVVIIFLICLFYVLMSRKVEKVRQEFIFRNNQAV
jgi:hypothetical protein